MRCPSCRKWIASFETACPHCGMVLQVADAAGPAAPLDPAGQVVAELRKPQKAWYVNLAILVLTVGLFIGIGTLKDPLTGILTVVAALAVHELGHWLAMKAFRYSDVRVFFVPLVGAAASGNPSASSRSARPLVDLAGGVLGIIAGIGAAVAFGVTRQELLRSFAQTSLVLNLFNLVPLYPLDGGRFLRDVLLIRSSTAEAVFQGIAAACLVALAVLLRSPVLGLLGAWSLVAIRWTLKAGRLARELAPSYGETAACSIESAPDELLHRFIRDVQDREPSAAPARLVPKLRDVWDRIRTRPPRAGAAIGLIVLYLVMILVGIIARILLLPRP